MIYVCYSNMTFYKLKNLRWMWIMIYIWLVQTASVESRSTASTYTYSTTTSTIPTTTVIPFGDSCSSGVGNCAFNFVCDITTKTCMCLTDHYYNSTDSCSPKKNQGGDCSKSSECINNLTCVVNKCGCSEGYYYNSSGFCGARKKNQGVDCGTNSECINNLTCVFNKCGCSDGYYYSSSGFCGARKKNQGVDCGTNSECINNLTCVFNKCGCSDGYYYSSSGFCGAKKHQGVDCGTNSECINNLTCVFNKCGCSEGYYYSSSGFCEAKKNQGVDCGSNSECINNLTCVVNKCGCSEGYYYSSSGFCGAKLDHGVVCQSSDQCKVPSTACTSYLPANTTRCLCASGFYWTDNRSCISKSNLNIVATVAGSDRGTRNITFHWADSSQRSDVAYSIKRDGSNSMDANKIGVTVGGLDPGTSYIFSVVTSLQADGNYPLIEETRAQSEVWTFPDKPGEVIPGGVRRIYIDNTTYEVTFGQSSGRVNQYKMNVSLAGSFTEEQSSTSHVLYFKKLQPATTYNYTLWSENVNGDKSVPVTGHFTTDAEESGPVDGLSSTGVQSDTANVTWRPPLDPRGNITGYLVEVALQGSTQCLYYFKIPCHGCSQPPTIVSAPSCNLTNANITVSDKLYNLELPNLKPYQYYTVTVRAVTERGLGQSNTLTFQTSTSVPNDILDLRVNSVRNESSLKVDLIITWKPGELTGPTNYYISGQAENYNESKLMVTGYNNTFHVIYDVLAYWIYNVSVLAQTDQRNSSEKFTLYRTVENDPGPVQNLHVSQDSTIANILTLTFECPEITSRNGIIEQFTITQTLLNPQGNEEKEKKYNHSASVGEPCNSGYRVNAIFIIVERNYSFTVLTVNNKYAGGSTNWSNFYVQPQAPQPAMLIDLLNVDSLVKQQEYSSEQTKINAMVCSTCLADTRWGSVVNVGLIVCVRAITNCAWTGRKKRSTTPEFKDYPSWTTAKQNSFKVAYRTTPDNWRIPPVSGNNYSPFVVGENTSCANASTADYCNGPLPAGKEFIISVIMCTTAGCTIYSEPGIFKASAPPDESSNVGAIIGGVLGGLALVAVICVSILLIIWIRSRTEKTEVIRNNTHTRVKKGNNPTSRQTPIEHISLPQTRDNSHIYDEIVDPDIHPQPPSSVIKDERSQVNCQNDTGDSIEHYFPYENVVW